MADHGHCPFLNRTDSRCGKHLNIDALDHAFDYCFDVYAACPHYLELLIERRTKGEGTTGLEVRKSATERMKLNVSGIVQVQVRRAGQNAASPAVAYSHP
jgi:hypothetical protein